MSKERSFNIFVDTGGTFTDLIAHDSDGNSYRRKILSNASIRGKITGFQDSSTLIIEENWEPGRDMFSGFIFRIIDKKRVFESIVLSYDIKNKHLTIENPVPEEYIGNELSFELLSGEEAPVLAARLVTETALAEELPTIHMRLGSTKGTNALLEHKGARVALFITRGFGDLLEIGTQQRPDIFSLNIEKHKPLPEIIIEVDERIDSGGNILKKLNAEQYSGTVAELKQSGIKSVAVAFLHAYKNPKHELEFKEFLEQNGIKYISVSSELSPLIKILERAESSVVNAYLAPIIDNYLKKVSVVVGKDLLVMNSAGGLVNSETFHPKDSLLSGPAGGVVGAASIGKDAGIEKLITFDMGGTSTDVSRYNSAFDYSYELEIGDAKVYSPSIAIETVAAGGGSICAFDGFKLTVGPESAGADPGPACYGAGGPLALTDVNLLLGRMDISSFGIPVKMEDAEKRIGELIHQMDARSESKHQKEQLLTGFLEIANEIMAGTIKKISTLKGFDPAGYALMAFGGAGGMHACGIAQLLNIKQIIIPRDAGLLSAFGIGTASVERFAEQQVLQLLDDFYNDSEQVFNNQIENANEKLSSELADDVMINVDLKEAAMRFIGQDSTINVNWQGSKEQLINSFRKKYVDLYGHWVENRDIEVESIRVKVSAKDDKKRFARDMNQVNTKPEISHFIKSWNGSEWVDVPVFLRDCLKPGHSLDGFAIITDDKSTTVVEQGWTLRVDVQENLILNKTKTEIQQSKSIQQNQETKLELFTNRFMSVASNMGAILQRTALSVNIKERLDFSCALLDTGGYLVANAPHIPVHLGSLGICVRTLLQHVNFEEGDTIVTNHPFYGGSHLPDVTLVTPVFSEGSRVGFVVNRAHHAEIGGIAPGSMPPSATNLAEEGVTISPFHLVRKGIPDWTGMKSILENAPYPSRLVDENLADLNAALAANIEGANTFEKLVNQFGIDEVLHYMDLLRNHATNKMRKVLSGMDDGEYFAEEFLDDGAKIKVRISIKGEAIEVDFTGSGQVHPRNMNATPAIVNSVVIYVMRLLLDEIIPLNDGLMEPVKIILPEGFLNPSFDRAPEDCPAVVGGNVEVSQRLTDTLLKAFGIAACSQGTMNNVLFGNDRFGYYETICGGTGAGEGFIGASAVHQHMTNTRITDPEVLEHRFPVRLNRFEIRKESGGLGMFKGGNGVIREYTFLEDVELSILSQHRLEQPYGMDGGGSGKNGRQWILKSDGQKVSLKGVDHVHLEKGDIFVVETPGGGGWGNPVD